ncbi:hypothetical protein SteCoe_28648 [Stentor coeruleus]|uniref:Uncharacterized protein n=1 Tax=Stentor coeruleus TaxID=5963 RepID=A0A1R2B7N9_9CILI|nr:hypothetical protein SteCoe_28648 [Stentor coeruleus]
MSNPIIAKDKESLEVFKLLFDFSQQKTYFKRIRISHFWTEKVNIILQLIQLFGFIFAANYESWPIRWQGIFKSSYLSLVVGDLGTIMYDDLILDPTSRLLYSGGWIIFTAGVALIYLFIRFVLHLSILFRVEFQRIFFKLAHFMYLPIALGVIPAALCQYSDCKASGQQLILSILALFVLGFYLIGYPIYLIVHTCKQVITTDSDAYDEFIRLKEMEFLLGVSSSWLTEKLYLFSSYRSSWLRVYHRPIYYAFVLSLVIVHGALNTNNGAKMLILVCISAGFSFYISIFPIYRCISSSCLYGLSLWLITANLFIGFLRASGYNSQTMNDTNLVNILVAINITGLVLIGIIISVVLLFKMNWDVGIETVKQLAIGYRFLLADLRNAQTMILTLKSFNNFHFVKVKPILDMEEILIEHYGLLSKENHPLQYTVIEQLDILTFLRDQVRTETFLPNKNLERDYLIFAKVVNRRWKEQILISPIKRRILLKLGVLNMFIGNRCTSPFNSGENLNFDDKGVTKGQSDYDLQKFYKDFENFEDSREMAIDTKRDAFEDIEESIANKDYDQLARLTLSELEVGDQNMLSQLREIWDKIGPQNLAPNIRTELYAL